MSNETKSNKKIFAMCAVIGGILIAAIATLLFLDAKEKKEDTTVTQGLYTDMMQLVKNVELPAYFDKKAMQNIYLSSTLNDESEKSEEKNELLLDVIFFDEKSEQTISYTVLNNSNEYDYSAENDGELIKLDNGQEVYKYQGGYFLKLKGGLYASVFSHNENPDDELLKKTITSVDGKSKLDVNELLGFDLKTKVKEPTYTTDENEKNAYAIAVEYTNYDEKPASTLALYYNNFVFYQSYDVDYTSENIMGENTEEKFEKMDQNGKNAYVDKEYNSIYYTNDDLSVWLLPNGENSNKEEMMKVFESIGFNE